MINSFENYHPLVNFYYFSFVIRRALKFNILYMLPLMLITALINPAFNHEGVTILFYLKGGNPITLESIVYGIVAATMFISVIVWFSCYNEIMTSDKFIYLWGRIIPSLSLIFSMVLRFVPKYKAQIKVISNAQKAIGRDVTKGNIIRRARNGIKILSIMVTWALENAIETADSMKARGYGLKGRTSFSNFKFSKRDKIVLFLMIVLSLIVIIGVLMKVNRIRYFPRIKIARNTIFTIIVDISYFLFCVMPIILTVIDEIRWKRINK